MHTTALHTARNMVKKGTVNKLRCTSLLIIREWPCNLCMYSTDYFATMTAALYSLAFILR